MVVSWARKKEEKYMIADEKSLTSGSRSLHPVHQIVSGGIPGHIAGQGRQDPISPPQAVVQLLQM